MGRPASTRGEARERIKNMLVFVDPSADYPRPDRDQASSLQGIGLALNTGKEARMRQSILAADARRTDGARKEHRGHVEDALDLRIYETKEIGQDLKRMSNRVGEELVELRKLRLKVGALLERLVRAQRTAEECYKRHSLGDQDKPEVVLKASIKQLGELIAEF